MNYLLWIIQIIIIFCKSSLNINPNAIYVCTNKISPVKVKHPICYIVALSKATFKNCYQVKWGTLPKVLTNFILEFDSYPLNLLLLNLWIRCIIFFLKYILLESGHDKKRIVERKNVGTILLFKSPVKYFHYIQMQDNSCIFWLLL